MKLLRPLAVAAGGTLAVHWSPATAAVLPGVARAFGIPTGLASDHVLLTFDDGPHPEGTPAVLRELDRVGASAVFFVSGEQVERYPELVSEIVAAGHELGLHDDVHRARAAVADAAGIEPRLYRPPHGVFSLAGLRLVRELGLEPMFWSKWGCDCERRASSETIAVRVIDCLRAGDVVLLHDADHYSAHGSWRATAAAIGPIADLIAAAGLQTASV